MVSDNEVRGGRANMSRGILMLENMSVVVAKRSKDLNEAKSWFAHLKVFVVVVVVYFVLAFSSSN